MHYIARKPSIRTIQTAISLALFVAVWGVGLSADSGPRPVLPVTENGFSLDLRVVESFEHDLVYAVEQRSRPFYRIFSFDPTNGNIETVFTVPEDAIIYGIALSPDRSNLAVAYSRDFHFDGNGLWTIDLSTFEMTEQVPEKSDIYFTDVTWAADDSTILATHVDRTSSEEALQAVSISLEETAVSTVANGAINPVQVGEDLYYLNLDENKARRSIGRLDASGQQTTVDIEDSSFDLDHLISDHTRPSLMVSVLEPVDGGVTIGEPADAHGNHDLPSTWWEVALGIGGDSSPTVLEPIVVYDAAASSNAIVYATNEGLSIGATDRNDLIKSRAIRFVAA